MLIDLIIIILIGALFGALGCAIHAHNEYYTDLFKRGLIMKELVILAFDIFLAWLVDLTIHFCF